MNALWVILIIIAIIVILFVAYRLTIGKKAGVDTSANLVTRNDKNLSNLTFLDAGEFIPNVPVFSFER